MIISNQQKEDVIVYQVQADDDGNNIKDFLEKN